jgi:hypothetical protein
MPTLQEECMDRIATLFMAALVCLGMNADAVAAPQGTGPEAAAMTDMSAQIRRRSRTRIVVYPRVYPRLVGPRYFGFSEFPRPYPYDWPGPYAKRDCVAWLAAEARLSGPVVVPRQRCWWIPQ